MLVDCLVTLLVFLINYETNRVEIPTVGVGMEVDESNSLESRAIRGRAKESPKDEDLFRLSSLRRKHRQKHSSGSLQTVITYART